MRDAAPATRSDGATVEGGVDAAASGVTDPGWAPLPGFPEGCVIERAEHPEALLSVAWEPCAADVPGCLMLVDDRKYQRAIQETASWHEGEHGYFVVVQGESVQADRMVVLARTDGKILGAWQGPTSVNGVICLIDAWAGGDGYVAFEVMIWPDESQPLQTRLYHAPLAEIGQVTEPLAVLEEAFSFQSTVQSLAVSSTTVAAEVQPVGFVAVGERGRLERLDAPPDALGSPQNLSVVGHDVLWESWGDWIRIVHGAVGTPPSAYRAVDGADVRPFEADGTSLAWVQGYNYDLGTALWERMELWTSQYSRDPGDLNPRKVVELEHIQHSVFGDGVFAFWWRTPDNAMSWVELYDIADGRRRDWRLPAGAVVRELLYVATQEMLLTAAFQNRQALFRIDLAAAVYE